MERYTRVKKIGEGSFGKALLVKRKADGKQFVVKEINISKMARKQREESRKEVKVLAQMKHPNIVSYLESFESSGNLFIVMDYCDGGDLYQKINSQRGRLFGEEQVMNWFVQICLALKHVHDRKILHRDIKTQNIFLTKSGTVKLGDFGIARVLNSTMELARTCIGTPYYLSPEICENKPYNNKSDIWALGCVLYELTTLKHAFEAGNMRNLVLKIVRGSYPAIPAHYSRDLRSLVDSCLCHAPRDRPSVNGILRLTFVQQRIESFLSETIMADEFSHTVMHRNKPVARVAGGRGGVPQAAKPVQVKPPAALQPIISKAPKLDVRRYDPARVYGPPVKRRSEERKRAGPARPAQPSVPVRKPVSAALVAARREAEERERQRKEQIDQQHAVQAALAQRQKAIRQQQAKREWQRLLSGGNLVAHGDAPGGEDGVKNGGPAPQAGEGVGVIYQAEKDRREAGEASERARVVEEYQQRRREAAANKLRGQAQWLPSTPPTPVPTSQDSEPVVKQSVARAPKCRNAAEEEYLAKLHAIRRRNYLEKKRIMEKVSAKEVPPNPSFSPERAVNRQQERGQEELDARRKKIAALKAQADQQAEHMRRMVEEKKRQRMAAEQLAKEQETPVVVEPHGKEAEPRGKWAELQEPPQLARRGDASVSMGDETSSVIVFERPPEIKAADDTPEPLRQGAEPPQQGAEPRRQWGEGGSIVSLLQKRELETCSSSSSGGVGSGTHVVFTKWQGNQPSNPTATYVVPTAQSDEVDAPSCNVTGPSDDAVVPSNNRPEQLTSSPVGVVKEKTTIQSRSAWEEPATVPEATQATPTQAPSTKATPTAGEKLEVEDIELVEPQQGLTLEPQQVSTLEPQQVSTLEPQQVSTSEPQQVSTLESQQGPTLEPQQGSTLEPQQGSTLEPQQGPTLEPQQGPTLEPQQETTLEPQQVTTLEPQQGSTLEPQQGSTLEPQQGPTLEPQQGSTLEPQHVSEGEILQPQNIPPQAHSTPEKETISVDVEPSSSSSFLTATSRPGTANSFPDTASSGGDTASCRADTASSGGDGSRLSQSLRDGEFDTSTQHLRTCSLPNLHSSQSLERAAQTLPEQEDEKDEEDEENEGKSEDSEEQEENDQLLPHPSETTPTVDELDGEGGDGDSMPGDGDGEGDDGEGSELSDSEDEDDDLRQLVRTLQEFVRDSKTPPCSPRRAAAVSSDLEIVSPLAYESWVDSDEGAESEGGPASSESVFNQLERTRVELETKIGIDSLLQAYHLIQSLQEEGEAVDEEFPMAQLTDIVGPNNTEICPAIIHLTLADSAYSLLAPPTSEGDEETKQVGNVEVEVEVEG